MPIRRLRRTPRSTALPRRGRTAAIALVGLLAALPALAQVKPLPPAPGPTVRCVAPTADHPAAKSPGSDSSDTAPPHDGPDTVWTEGSVSVSGAKIDYCAVAGTLLVHPRDWDDSANDAGGDADDNAKNPATEATMFYVGYFKRGAEAAARPITFLFNGGPGSSTMWLHMGAFGPRRVATANAMHAAPAPYRLVNNDQSLLDASDLVFIDAPATGFGRITGPNRERAFFGLDVDAYAFASFISRFLTKYQRWNSPKYLFGESYGTMRAAVLVNLLQTDPGVDFNGVMLLSQVLSADLYPDQPETAPGNDLPYLLGLPTYAATAWYQQQPPDQRTTAVPASLLDQAERFAMGDYAAALAAGASLSAAARDAVVAKLHELTGLSEAYLRRADLRVSADEFRQELLRDRGLIVGGTDTRFVGHTLDRLSRMAHYDPSDSAIASAYVSSFNDYVRRVLKYDSTREYRADVDAIVGKWDFSHQPPNGPENGPPFDQMADVLPDLAHAMTTNPFLKVQVNAGYFDLLTPYFQGKYEMRHLLIPAELRNNIEYRCYQSGHMVYLDVAALAQLHDNAADFIARTDNLPAPPAHATTTAATCGSDQ